MTKNLINVYYKGIKQTIKYYGKFDELSIKKTIKQVFKINESLEQIFFQDEDGDILSLNKDTPSGISVYVFVEPDAVPKNPSKELQVPKTEEKLIKFHWIPQICSESCVCNGLNVIKNKYLYTTINDNDIHPGARSSCTFESGTHFLVLRKPRLGAYTMLVVADENKTSVYSSDSCIGYVNGDDDKYNLYCQNLGILIDMKNKKCAFYDYDRKIKKFEQKITFPKAKILVWLKRHACNQGEGISILNEGCIPIPDWVKNL